MFGGVVGVIDSWEWVMIGVRCCRGLRRSEGMVHGPARWLRDWRAFCLMRGGTLTGMQGDYRGTSVSGSDCVDSVYVC